VAVDFLSITVLPYNRAMSENPEVHTVIARYGGGERGARSAARAGAVVVVVDAFRASTTIAVLVSMGARVFPVASIQEAASVSADFRIGERGSVKVDGFDFGNSPTEILASEIPPDSTVALSTTNGTRIVEAAAGARAILSGAFVNAGRLAEYLSDGTRNAAEVAVIGCGWEGRRASEDEAAAGTILHRLESRGAELDEWARRVVERYLSRSRSTLTGNSAARRLKRVGYERDLQFCLAEDTVPVVPRLVGGAFVG
jgi:2-phosphosulfolactate phosphatase